jgi:hypothetical protein
LEGTPKKEERVGRGDTPASSKNKEEKQISREPSPIIRGSTIG